MGRAADPLPFQAPQFAAVALQTDAHLGEKDRLAGLLGRGGGAAGRVLCGSEALGEVTHSSKCDNTGFVKSEICFGLNTVEEGFTLIVIYTLS